MVRVTYNKRLRQISRRVMSVTVALLVTSACSLPGAAPTQSALLPTRTAAPTRLVPSAAPEATATAVPVAATAAQASSTPSPIPVSLYPACAAADLQITVPQRGAPAVGKIVYIALDGNVALTDPTGIDQLRVTTNANTARNNQPILFYTFPTFSPDASALTFVGYGVDGDVISQTLYTAVAADSASLLPLYSTSQYNIPYADWSPDGQMIAFLTIDPQQGYLRFVGKDGGTVLEVERGSSVYWNWRTDSAALFAHLGGSPATDADAHHAIIDVGAQAAQRITAAPGYYKSPHYSPDGRYVLYVERTVNADELVIADAAGAVLCSVSILDTGAAFAWSPDGKRVAWIDSGATTNLTAPLVVLDLGSGKTQRLHNDAIAFFWSPDSERVVVYSVAAAPADKPASSANSSAAQSASALRIEVVNTITANRVLVADTRPSRAVQDVLSFFDQYARALTPWSPAGDQLVFTDVRDDASTIDLFVATLHADAGSVTLKRIGSAAVAFWSPR